MIRISTSIKVGLGVVGVLLVATWYVGQLKTALYVLHNNDCPAGAELSLMPPDVICSP